ncbi:hypothetical protein WME73_27535 [Sorangium sp. So ce302]|uniref:hypothetical protein n=1 Tax=Sorangium sp. So ce302 TaxID=3133297 RepID=UPI003F5F88A2
MKRIHLFEIEDFSWFPGWLRACMTRLIVVMHRALGTREALVELIARALKESNTSNIVDLCSGSGGPMIDVVRTLREKPGFEGIQLTLTDLYPSMEAAELINNQEGSNVSYRTSPVDATKIDGEVAGSTGVAGLAGLRGLTGLRTMVSSFHHMRPDDARKILESAQRSRQPICIFEISDNSHPLFLGWLALPINFVMCLLITPLARPMTLRQLVFTYIVPIIPLCFAWDGAVSNARTYTLDDLDELLSGLRDEDYRWEKGVIGGRAKKLYLLGIPTRDAGAGAGG